MAEKKINEGSKIAMFGHKRWSREGGVEIVVKELCTRMAQKGCEVTCYNRSGHHVSGVEYDSVDTLTMLFFCVVVLIYTLGCRTGGGTGQSGCQVPRWYQLRDLSVPHGNLSCA